MAGENETESNLLKNLMGHESETDAGGDDDQSQQNEQLLDDNDQQQQKDDQQQDDDGDIDDLADRSVREANENRRERQQQKPQKKDAQQQQQNNQQQQFDPFDPRTKLDDVNGDLKYQGRLIAAKGRERRNFEAARAVVASERKANIKLTGRIQELASGARELFNRYETLKEQKTLFEQSGLSAEDQRLMLDIATAYKKSPVDGIKLMLTKAHLAGVDITKLGVPGGLDTRLVTEEIAKIIDDRLKPVTTLTSERADQNKILKEAEGFYERNPEAEEFANSLPGGAKQFGKLMQGAKQAAPDVSLDELWRQLHYQILRRGGIQALQGQRRPNQERGGREQERRRNERPNPRNRSRGDESFDDIGKSVLEDIRRLS